MNTTYSGPIALPTVPQAWKSDRKKASLFLSAAAPQPPVPCGWKSEVPVLMRPMQRSAAPKLGERDSSDAPVMESSGPNAASHGRFSPSAI